MDSPAFLIKKALLNGKIYLNDMERKKEMPVVGYIKGLSLCHDCNRKTLIGSYTQYRCKYRKRPVSTVDIITGEVEYSKVEGDYTQLSKKPYPLCEDMNPEGNCQHHSKIAKKMKGPPLKFPPFLVFAFWWFVLVASGTACVYFNQ